MHYYITVDMDTVVEIVDIIGGIHYNVDVAVRDDSGYGQIVIHPGYQLLNGRDYLEYVRFRAIGGDTGRMKRQQEILVESFRQVRDKGKLTQLPAIYNTLTQNLETNLTLTQIGALANFGLKVDLADISTHTFLGDGHYSSRGIFYMIMDEQKRVEMINKVFGVWVPTRIQVELPGQRPAPVEPAPVEEVFEPNPYPVYPAYDDNYYEYNQHHNQSYNSYIP